jgi:hypothetical protein
LAAWLVRTAMSLIVPAMRPAAVLAVSAPRPNMPSSVPRAPIMLARAGGMAAAI